MTLAAQTLTVAGRLDAVTASLAPGTVTAICGPNGAGKSTLLQALAGLLRPDHGHVLLDGRDVATLAPRERARDIGYLAQTGEIAWDLSVETLVALARLPHGDQGEAQVAAALAALDLIHLAHRPISTLSGGERGRALLARVVAGEPRWILADEPLAALDLAHQLALMGHLRQAAAAGVGVVLVVHDLALAMNHADRAIVLDRGALVADGPPSEALAPGSILTVWGVQAAWIGETGVRALAVTGSPAGPAPRPAR